MRKYISIMLVLLTIGFISGCDLAARQLLAQFSMDVEPEEVEIPAGDYRTVNVIINPFVGISLSPVTVKLINAPQGVSAPELTFVQGGQRDWTISVAPTVVPDVYELEAHGISQGMTIVPPQQTVKFTLVVLDPNAADSNTTEN